ncbi:carbohydrate-binding domain-containing protein [Curvibacter sp. HBC61]|uniref:Carbohydrate-binding domain-containing protein n=1 Tax=Curvibacter cyanobacteriorum TaxID=3026422 RepID=A0ABT5N5C3_9BURK|nr:LamG-like jellyroll fold domain-containing protein [Curvibacter sp. HBC61]MDD0840759.1 carbohydrate-binding domain-containing protein [Curvibacter sp. HBC61]
MAHNSGLDRLGRYRLPLMGGCRLLGIWRQVWWSLLLGLLLAILSAGARADETIVVNAYGQGSGGVWPNMQVWVNGIKISGTTDVTVGDAAPPEDNGAAVYSPLTAYTFTAPTSPASHPHLVIDVAFTNDGASGGQDRNLFIASVEVRGQILKGSDPAALLFKSTLPAQLLDTNRTANATDIVTNNKGNLYWTGTLRLFTKNNLVGSCTGAAYPTITAAVAAASPGDVIPICAGTYNEAVVLDKSLTLTTATGGTDVTVNGGASPAVTLADDARLASLLILNLRLTSNVQGLHARSSNHPLALMLSQVSANTVGTAFDLLNANLSGVMVSPGTGRPSVTSTNGSAFVFNSTQSYVLSLRYMTLTSRQTALIVNGPANSNSRHQVNSLVIDTRSGTVAHGVAIYSGTVDMSDVTAKTSGVGVLLGATSAPYAYFNRLSLYSVGNGIQIGSGYGASAFSDLLIQTSGSGSRGIQCYAANYFARLTISTDGDAIYTVPDISLTQTYQDLVLNSANGMGIHVASMSAGTALSAVAIGGSGESRIRIHAKTIGIHVNGRASGSHTLDIHGVSITGAQQGIVTGPSLLSKISLGVQAPVNISTPTTLAGGWALDLNGGNTVTVQNLNVNSINGGVRLGSAVTGAVAIQGTALAPVQIVSSGEGSHAMRLQNSGSVVLDYLTLHANAGFGLQVDASTALTQLSNFDIQSRGDGVYVSNQPNDLSLSNGQVRVTGAGANGIYLAAGSQCNQAKLINQVTATAGDGGIALYVGCASTAHVSGSCLRNGATGLGFGAGSGRISVTGTATSGASYLALSVASTTPGGTVSGSCFAANNAPAAQSTSGQTFSGNYWQGNSAAAYSSGNINDNNALANCPLAASQCPVSAGTTRLLAAYDFEESAAWTGAAGEIRDTAASAGGPYNGQLYVVGGAGTAPLKASASPARPGSPGTCSYAQLQAGGAISLPNLPVNVSPGAKTTVSFWMKWNGGDAMPMGWYQYDLWFYSGSFGFNTGVSDVYGVSSSGFINTWRHVVAVFTNGDVTQNTLYIDGVAQPLSQRHGAPQQASAVVSSTLRVGGWSVNNGWIKFPGSVDQVRIYDGALSPSQVMALYNEAHNCGGQLIAQYRFEDSAAYAGVAGELADSAGHAGGPFHGKAIGQPLPNSGAALPARTGTTGTCGYARLSGPLTGGGAFEVRGLPVSTAAGAKTSVAFWMYWDGTSGVRPLGWDKYDLWLAAGAFGFNTSNNDVQGIVPTGLEKAWHHIVAVFTNGDVTQNELYIDGVQQSLRALQSAANPSNAVVQGTLLMGGWGSNSDHRFTGYLDELKVFNGAVSAAQVLSLYNEVHACGGTGPVAEWRMDELTWASGGEVQLNASWWRGDVGAVLDSGPHGLHGTAQRYSGGRLPTPTPHGKVCGAGDFSGAYNRVSVENDVTDQLSHAVTIMAWAKQPSAATYNYIFSNSRDCCGSYRGFNLAATYSSRSYFQLWTADQVLQNLNSPSTMALNTWVHLAATFDGTTMRLYRDGNQIGSRVLSATTIGNPASWGGVIGALANCPTCDGNLQIDELKIWNRVLSASEITVIYNHENAGLSWDGSTRDCGNQAPISDWHYDEHYWTGTPQEVKDSSPQANHAQAFQGASSSAVGKVCRAGSFSGVMGDGLQDGVQAGIPLSGLSSQVFSTSMWVRFNSLSNEQLMMYVGISGSGTATSNRYFYLSTFRSDGLGWDGLHFGVTGQSGSWGRAATVNARLFQTGVWQHVVTVNDLRTGRLTGYVDGVRVYDALTPAGSIPGTPAVIYVGYTPEGGRITNALFDEVLIFNGAISAAQVQAIYTNQAAGKNWDGSIRDCPNTPGVPGLLNAFDTGTAAGAVSGYVTTKVAGNSVTVDVVALNALKTEVDTSFNQTVKVEVIANPGLGVDVDNYNCPVSGTVLSTTRVAIINGRSSVTLPVVANAWRDARIRLSFPPTGAASVVTCSNDNFALRPWALGFVARDADWQTAGNARTLDAATETSGPVHKAGQPFTLIASAYDSGGALSTNYAGLPTVAVANCQLPASGCVGGVLQAGAFSGGGGTVISNTAVHSEVGVIQVQLQDDSFAQVDATDGSTSTQRTVYSPLVTVGRFVPDHFSVLPVSATPACTSGSNPFTYLGQDGLLTVATLVAQNAQGQTTRNYTGSLARLDLTQYSFHGFDALNLPSGSVLGSGAQAPSGFWSQGVAFQVQSNHLISKPVAAVAPASVTVTTRPVDLDGVTTPAAVTLASAQRYVFGRLKLGNAFGAPSTDLVLPLSAQYWDGSRFVTHSADNCTGFARSAVGFRNFTSDLTAAETGTSHLVGSSWQLSQGVGSLRVSRPSGGDGKYRGSSDVFINLGTDAVCSNGSSTVAPGLGHLQGRWSWIGGLCSNPVGRMTYGADRQPWVFRREVY